MTGALARRSVRGSPDRLQAGVRHAGFIAAAKAWRQLTLRFEAGADPIAPKAWGRA
jgi:hypothetical protein